MKDAKDFGMTVVSHATKPLGIGVGIIAAVILADVVFGAMNAFNNRGAKKTTEKKSNKTSSRKAS